MKSSIIKLTFLFSFLFINTANFAQTKDEENCKDHPLFNRMPNFIIMECAENFNKIEIPISGNKSKDIEGNVSRIVFDFNVDVEFKMPSQLQVIKNFENAVTKMNGKTIFSSLYADDFELNGATFNFSKDKKEYWVKLELKNDPVNEYILTVISIESMKQEITANEMFEAINSGNSLALYINFDTGKATVKDDSYKIIDEIFQLLSINSSLKISIEGHTDNVGNKITNQGLSEQRAVAIKQNLVKKGIKEDRIKTLGLGQNQPISENNSEEGKAKNRRVEIKKI